MASTTTSIICNNFSGIQKQNATFSSELVTCSDCQNVELYYTNQNSGIGLRTSQGNTKIATLNDNEKIIAMHSASFGGSQYLFLYVEDDQKGYLKYLDGSSIKTIGEGFKKGVYNLCSFSVFSDSWLDILVLSNGNEIKYYSINNESEATKAEGIKEISSDELTLKDSENRDVSGLGLVNFDSRLWLFKNNILWYSKQGDCRNFNFQDPNYVASAGFIEMGKRITAIHTYNGQLAVFFSDGYRFVTTDTTTGFGVGSECSLGCADLNSLLYHGAELYVFDNNKKMIYALSQTATGDTTTTENLANDVQDILSEINPLDLGKGYIRTESVVTEDKNELWFLLPFGDKSNSELKEKTSLVLVYDYKHNAWLKRLINKCSSICLHQNVIYSANSSLYQEYNGYKYGENLFIPSYYKCSALLVDSYNTLKITKFPPRIIVDNSTTCDFWVEYTKNYDISKPSKLKEIICKKTGEIAKYVTAIDDGEYVTDESGNILYYEDISSTDEEKVYTNIPIPKHYTDGSLVYDYEDVPYVYDSNYVTRFNGNAVVKLPASTFKSLEIKFFTQNEKEGFSFKSLEIINIKVKQV